MADNRKVEVFMAGCPLCADAMDLVRETVGDCCCCDVAEVDVNTPEGATRAREVGVRQVPAVAVDGTLAGCCCGGLETGALRASGVGVPS